MTIPVAPTPMNAAMRTPLERHGRHSRLRLLRRGERFRRGEGYASAGFGAANLGNALVLTMGPP